MDMNHKSHSRVFARSQEVVHFSVSFLGWIGEMGFSFMAHIYGSGVVVVWSCRKSTFSNINHHQRLIVLAFFMLNCNLFQGKTKCRILKNTEKPDVTWIPSAHLGEKFGVGWSIYLIGSHLSASSLSFWALEVHSLGEVSHLRLILNGGLEEVPDCPERYWRVGTGGR